MANWIEATTDGTYVNLDVAAHISPWQPTPPSGSWIARIGNSSAVGPYFSTKEECSEYIRKLVHGYQE